MTTNSSVPGMTMRILVLLSVLFSFLAGCSTPLRQGDPAPIISREGYTPTSAETRQEGQVKITPLQQSSTIHARPVPNRAVQLLHERAQSQMHDGDLAGADKSLERALSIQPQNARSWNLLAHLRAEQSSYAMAADIAAKSNTMVTAGENALKKDNLLLMAKMKSLLGKTVEAERLLNQANAIE